MTDPAHLPFLQFICSELGRLHRGKHSGTLFATTMHGRLAQFGLDEGEIVYLSFQNIEGMEAIAKLKEAKGDTGSSRFAPGRHRGVILALPPTRDLLGLLAGGSTTPKASFRTASIRLTTELKALIEEELTEIGGPIAKMLCEELWETEPENLEQALISLSMDLSDSEASALRSNVLKRLQ